MKKYIVGVLGFLTLISCSSTTEEGQIGIKRKQLLVVSADQINEMSYMEYDKMKASAQKAGALNKNSEQLKRVRGIADRLIPHTAVFRSDAPKWNWEVNVVDSPELNAFCMPGGKMMFYSGIIDSLKLTDPEIAAIMGHEMAHALREHGRERMSQELIKQGVLQVGVATGQIDAQKAQYAMLLTALTISLPHGRGQEIESDEIGLELMARAGYDPRGAITLWEKMGAASSGGKPPEILSTHPSDKNRRKRLEDLMPKVMPLYKAK